MSHCDPRDPMTIRRNYDCKLVFYMVVWAGNTIETYWFHAQLLQVSCVRSFVRSFRCVQSSLKAAVPLCTCVRPFIHPSIRPSHFFLNCHCSTQHHPTVRIVSTILCIYFRGKGCDWLERIQIDSHKFRWRIDCILSDTGNPIDKHLRDAATDIRPLETLQQKTKLQAHPQSPHPTPALRRA